MKTAITISLLVSTLLAPAGKVFKNDAKFVSECIAKVDVSKDSNYQILLKNLFEAFEKRYQGMNIGEFDRRARAWGWERIGQIPPEAGYVYYDMKAVAYTPSPGYPHLLHLKVFVSHEKIVDSTPYMLLVADRIGYPKLLGIGYPPRSVLGRWVSLDNLKNKVTRAGAIDSISIAYQRFRYVSSAAESHVFCIEAELHGADVSDSHKVSYYVTSGLGYVSQSGEPPPTTFKGDNTLIKDPHDWNTITEKKGERVFYCDDDDDKLNRALDESKAKSNRTPKEAEHVMDVNRP